MNVLKSQNGMTIIEGLVSLTIVIAVTSFFVSGVSQIQRTTQKSLQISSTEKQVRAIAENIRAGVDSYQVSFLPTTNLNTILPPEDLPMAWSDTLTGPRASCTDCPGTYGFVVQPLENYRGLYQVTLRMTNREWTEPFRDYIFVVSGK